MDNSTFNIKDNLDIDNITDYMKNIIDSNPKLKENLENTTLNNIISGNATGSDVSSNKKKFIFNYNLQDTIKTDFHKINSNEIKKVHVCPFRFIESTKYNNISNPFLQYALFKYPSSSTKTPNLCIFPFENNKNKISIKETGKKIIKKLFNKQYNCLGYIQNDNNIFLFYNVEYKENLIISKKSKLLWCLIDEICNHRMILNFPIHESVSNLFFKNPELIYLKDSKKNNISIPHVYYVGREYSVLPFIYTIGMKASANRLFGPYYYFSNYLGSFRNAGWTTNYKRRRINNKILTDKIGLHKEGGIIRFAIFKNNSRLLTNNKKDKYNYKDQEKKWASGDTSIAGKWAKTYDTLICPILKDNKTDNILNSHTKVVVKNYSDIVPLTIQKIDKSSLPIIWNPNYTKYDIL